MEKKGVIRDHNFSWSYLESDTVWRGSLETVEEKQVWIGLIGYWMCLKRYEDPFSGTIVLANLAWFNNRKLPPLFVVMVTSNRKIKSHHSVGLAIWYVPCKGKAWLDLGTAYRDHLLLTSVVQSLVLSKYLERQYKKDSTFLEGKRVIELGSGCGIPGTCRSPSRFVRHAI